MVQNPFLTVPVLDSLDSKLGEYETEWTQVFTTLDGGNTQALLDAIYSGTMSAGELKNELLDNSPLSDTVLIAYTLGEFVPNGHYKQVITDNSPLSRNVLNHIDTYKASLPSGIMEEIQDVQLHNNRTLTAIGRDIAGTTDERSTAFNSLIAVLLNDTVAGGAIDPTALQWAIDLLEEDTITGHFENERVLVATYLDQNDPTSALTELSNIPVYTPTDQDYLDLNTLLIDLANNGKTLWEMSKNEMIMVTDIAERTIQSTATSNANAILRLVQARQLAYQYPLPASGAFEDETAIVEVEERIFLGDNLPNPFNSSTVIPYILPEDGEGELKVYGVDGVLIWQSGLLDQISPYVTVSTEDWAKGVYLYTLEVDGLPTETKKMVKQ